MEGLNTFLTNPDNPLLADLRRVVAKRTEFLRRRERERINRIAVKFADELRRCHGRVPSAAEAYEISEYGAPADAGRVHELLGILP